MIERRVPSIATPNPLNQGSFATRAPSSVGPGATSSAVFSVSKIIDTAFDLIGQVIPGGELGTDAKRRGLTALRMSVDTLNSLGVERPPDQFVSYRVRSGLPSLTWGLGEYDINDQPPLEISMLTIENAQGVFQSVEPLVPVDRDTILRSRQEQVFAHNPTMFYLEEGWPVRTLHLDGVYSTYWEGFRITERDYDYEVELVDDTTRGPEQPRFRYVSDDPTELIQQVRFDDYAIDQNPRLYIRFRDAEDYIYDTLLIRWTDADGATGEARLIRRDTLPHQFENDDTDYPIPPVGKLTFQLFYDGDETRPFEFVPEDAPMMTLAGWVKKAITLPQDDNDALNYNLNLPPGYTEFFIADVASVLAAEGNVKLGPELGLRRERALTGIRQQANRVPEIVTPCHNIRPGFSYRRRFGRLV